MGSIRITFRGTSDARSSLDRDTRIRIAISSTQAADLWHARGERLTDMEKQQSNRAPTAEPAQPGHGAPARNSGKPPSLLPHSVARLSHGLVDLFAIRCVIFHWQAR